MGHRPVVTTIRTRRLELAVLTASFVEAVVSGDLRTAERELGATLGRQQAGDPSHLIQLVLADRAAAEAGYLGVARTIVLTLGSRRRLIGSVGFHGPPDDHGRLEVSCRIHKAHRGRGYGAESTTGLIDWATTRFGVTRFLLAIPPRSEAPDLVPIEIEPRRATWSAEVEGLANLIEGATRTGW